MKPRLYVNAGAMKAGTTWLLQLLKTNKNVMTTPVKEIDYFSHLHTDYKLLHFKMRKERIQRIISAIGEGVSNKEMAVVCPLKSGPP